MSNLFAKLRGGLSRTRLNLVEGINRAISGKTRLDEETLEAIEERLIAADLGVDVALDLIDSLRRQLSPKDRNDRQVIIDLLQSELINRLQRFGADGEVRITSSPWVIMVTGVNGVGKTTTIGKLANRYVQEGRRVIVGAADTFRAAASEQLEIWACRANAEIVRNKPGADPAAVAYDTLTAALSRNADIVLIDTAGRLHTKSNLMEELKKIYRTIERKLPGAPHEVLLVLDATTGQNGLVQARVFKDAVKVSGLVLTKLDGTARGGIVVAIQEQLGVPVRYIGVGEQMDDLQPFVAQDYVEALFI